MVGNVGCDDIKLTAQSTKHQKLWQGVHWDQC